MINKFFNWVFGSFFRTAGRYLFYFLLCVLISFLLHSCEVKAVMAEDFNVYFKGSVYNGSSVVETFNSESDPTYKGYSSLPNGSVIKVYGAFSIYINNTALTFSQAVLPYLWTINVCSTFPIQSDYDIAYSGGGMMNIGYEVQKQGKCQLSSSLSGTMYQIPLVLQATNLNYGSQTSDVTFLVDVSLGKLTNSSGQYAITGYSFQEYTSEVAAAFNNANQNANIINQNGTIINQNGEIISQQEDMINQNTTIINQNRETQQKIDNVNNSITSTEGADLSALENSAGWLPAGPVDSILNLPLSLLNNVSSNLSKSCQPVIVNLPFIDKSFTLPCLNNIYSQIGNLSTWINTIGIIASAFILFSYFMKLYKWVDDTLTFRENNYLDNWGGV